MSIIVDEEEPLFDVEDPPFEPRDVQVRHDKWVEAEFNIHDFLGRGKFGEVKRCTEKSTGREFAAKFICAPRPQDKKDVEHEVDIMKKLQHKRLLQLYDCFCSKSEMCLVLEIILGGELFDRVIDDDFVLTERACVVFMRQICEGVDYMHSKNIIHLDMKPENILCLTRTGNRVKIIDFGLAREYAPHKDIRVLFGTPEFMAPEVVQYDPIDFSTDMWSVGVVCYVLLSGLSPFMGDNDGETLCNVIKGEYDFNYAEFDDVSEDAKDVIRKLLILDKSKRMTAQDCLNHQWLKREEPMRPRSSQLQLSKRRLKRFVYRRKWQKIVNAIIALKRMGVRLMALRRRRSLSGNIKPQESIFGWESKKGAGSGLRNGLRSPEGMTSYAENEETSHPITINPSSSKTNPQDTESERRENKHSIPVSPSTRRKQWRTGAKGPEGGLPLLNIKGQTNGADTAAVRDKAHTPDTAGSGRQRTKPNTATGRAPPDNVTATGRATPDNVTATGRAPPDNVTAKARGPPDKVSTQGGGQPPGKSTNTDQKVVRSAHIAIHHAPATEPGKQPRLPDPAHGKGSNDPCKISSPKTTPGKESPASSEFSDSLPRRGEKKGGVGWTRSPQKTGRPGDKTPPTKPLVGEVSASKDTSTHGPSHVNRLDHHHHRQDNLERDQGKSPSDKLGTKSANKTGLSTSGTRQETSRNTKLSTPRTVENVCTQGELPSDRHETTGQKLREGRPAGNVASVRPGQQGAQTGPAQQGAQTGPAQQGAHTGPAQQGAQTGPAKQGAQTRPAQQGAQTRPAQQGAQTRPAQQGAQTGPAQHGAQTGPAQQGAQTGHSKDKSERVKPAGKVTTDTAPRQAVPWVRRVPQDNTDLVRRVPQDNTDLTVTKTTNQTNGHAKHKGTVSLPSDSKGASSKDTKVTKLIAKKEAANSPTPLTNEGTVNQPAWLKDLKRRSSLPGHSFEPKGKQATKNKFGLRKQASVEVPEDASKPSFAYSTMPRHGVPRSNQIPATTSSGDRKPETLTANVMSKTTKDSDAHSALPSRQLRLNANRVASNFIHHPRDDVKELSSGPKVPVWKAKTNLVQEPNLHGGGYSTLPKKLGQKNKLKRVGIGEHLDVAVKEETLPESATFKMETDDDKAVVRGDGSWCSAVDGVTASEQQQVKIASVRDRIKLLQQQVSVTESPKVQFHYTEGGGQSEA